MLSESAQDDQSGDLGLPKTVLCSSTDHITPCAYMHECEM